jgi:hypothetical protein
VSDVESIKAQSWSNLRNEMCAYVKLFVLELVVELLECCGFDSASCQWIVASTLVDIRRIGRLPRHPDCFWIAPSVP